MYGRSWVAIGAIFGALGVGLGAFGAHGLRATLERLVPEGNQLADAARSAVPSWALEPEHAESPRGSAVAALGAPKEREIEKRLGWFDTAVRYQMYHAFALVLVGVLAMHRRSRWIAFAGGLFVLGIVLFCGLLVAMTFGGPRILGAIVPIGGVAMILGWLALAAGCWRSTTEASP